MKSCLFCKHFYFDGGTPNYSEWTPGSPSTMECFKKVVEFHAPPYLEDLQATYVFAENCHLYEREEE